MRDILGQTVKILMQIISWAIFIRVILSWFMPMPYKRSDNPFIDILYTLTEPILGPIRELLRKSSYTRDIPVDFSPIVAYLFLSFILGPILIRLIALLPF